MRWDPSWLERRTPRLAVLCAFVVGVASAALNFVEARRAASAARANLVAGPVLAPSQPLRLGNRVRFGGPGSARALA